MCLFCFDNYIKAQAQAQTGCQSSQGVKLQPYHNVLEVWKSSGFKISCYSADVLQ